MEVEYGSFFLSSYQQGTWVATGGPVPSDEQQQQQREQKPPFRLLHSAAATVESPALPLPGCRFFARPGPADLVVPESPPYLGRSASDKEHSLPYSNEDAAKLPTRLFLNERAHSPATSTAAAPCSGNSTIRDSVPEDSTPCSRNLSRCDLVPEVVTPRSGNLPRCDLVPKDTIQHDALSTRSDSEEKALIEVTATTMESTSPRILDLPNGIICDKLDITALDETVSAKEEPLVKIVMEDEPMSITEAPCIISQPEPEQEVPSPNEPCEHDFEVHDSTQRATAHPTEPSREIEVQDDTKMVLGVPPPTPSRETEEVELSLAPQAPVVQFNDCVEKFSREPAPDADHVEVCRLVDKLFEVHEQACMITTLTCKLHPEWELLRPGQRRPEGRFKVNAPEPHPGLEYRLTKRLHDRAGKIIENGLEVEGNIEDCGLWLLVDVPRSNGETIQYYLPMRVGDHQLVTEIDPPQQKGRKAKAPKTLFCNCEESATSKEQYRVPSRRRYTHVYTPPMAGPRPLTTTPQ